MLLTQEVQIALAFISMKIRLALDYSLIIKIFRINTESGMALQMLQNTSRKMKEVINDNHLAHLQISIITEYQITIESVTAKNFWLQLILTLGKLVYRIRNQLVVPNGINKNFPYGLMMKYSETSNPEQS
jgi:hypothetical protein